MKPGNTRLIVLATVSSLVTAGLATGEELRLTASDWAPYVDSTRYGFGSVPTMVTTAFERAGYDVELEFEPWPDSIEKTASGEYHVLIGAWRTGAREESLAFSDPYLVNEVTLMKMSNNPARIRVRDDLIGMRIGIVGDFAYANQPYDTADLDIVEFGDVTSSVEALLAGDIDVVIGDRNVLRHQVDLHTAGATVDVLPIALERRSLRIAVTRQRDDHEEIIAAFDKAIDEMKTDGTYNSILANYRISF